MTDIKTTEGEFRGLVGSWLNEFLDKGSYPFEIVTADPSIKAEDGKTRFPDIQIWFNREAGQGFCGWELKTIDTPVDDAELLENATEKARAMNADSFVTWNMRDAVIWRTPNFGEKITHHYRHKTYLPISQINVRDDLWDKSKQILLKERAKEILDDLVTLHRERHLHQVDVDSTFFVHLLHEAVKTLSPHIHNSLIEKIGKIKTFKEGLFDWAVKQGIMNFDDPAFYDIVSRQVVYRVIGKILFYLTLRKFRTDLPKLDLVGLNVEKVNEKLQEFFELARKIDYQAVFVKDVTDDVPFPSVAIDALVKLVNDLNRFNYSYMPSDVIGQVFERLIPIEERHSLGQYFTREELVDLINAFCINSKEDKILDPTCGTGTFLIRAYDKMKISGQRDHKKLLSQLWGIDVAPFPAELATINLYRQNIEDYANFPKVITTDFFEVKPGQTFPFPLPKPTGEIGQMLYEKMPEFDGAVGNFPYIRQELIEKRIKGYKKKIDNVISNDWKDDYRDLFDNGNVRISGQADIYTYLFFHTARFVKDEGRLGFVTSSAWLEVDYGFELQKFFLKNFKIVAILMSTVENWFKDVPVITTVSILERCKKEQERNKNLVKFVLVKKKFKELIPWDMKLDSWNRWAGIDRLIYKIEAVGHNRFAPGGGGAIRNTNELKTYEDNDFRIRIIEQQKLLEKVESLGKTLKWGQYLRAPNIYFEILEKCKDKLILLQEIADPRFGIKTGINEFFYLTKEKIEHWGIEKEFYAPIVSSPKEIEEIIINPKKLEFKVLLCHKSKKELLRERKKGVLEYIKWGEKQTTKEKGRHKKGGLPFPEAPSLKGRKYWYDIGNRESGDFLINRFIRERFFFPVNKPRVLLGDVVFEGKIKKKTEFPFYSAVLNSSIVFFFVELHGRFSMGDGLLTFYGPDIVDLPVPNYKFVSSTLRNKIVQAFNALSSRPIKPIFEEVKMKDRQKLDKLVLEALGLDPKTYLKPIYDGLCELVEERIGLAKMRKNAKNSIYKKDVEKLKESVIEEILPDGAKNFPEEFIDSVYLKDSKEISITGKPLKLGHFFMGLQEVVSEDGFKYEAKSLEEAKFIIYSQKPNSYIIKIPKNKIALSKVVHNYEKYLKELKGKFFETFFNRVQDHKQADSLTQQVFEELGLPDI